MAMNELEREMELAERAERRDDLMQRRQLLQKQRQAERQQREPARKARPAARALTRAKKPDNVAKASAMDQLKAARARKAQPRRCCFAHQLLPVRLICGADCQRMHACPEHALMPMLRCAGCGRTRIGRVSRQMSAAMRAPAGAAAALQVGG